MLIYFIRYHKKLKYINNRISIYKKIINDQHETFKIKIFNFNFNFMFLFIIYYFVLVEVLLAITHNYF